MPGNPDGSREVEYIKSRDRIFETVNLDDSIENIAETLRRFRIRSTVFIKGYSNVNLAGILYDELKKEEFRVYNVYAQKRIIEKKYSDKKTAIWRFPFNIRWMLGWGVEDSKQRLLNILKDSYLDEDTRLRLFEIINDSQTGEETGDKQIELFVDSGIDEETRGKLLEIINNTKIDEDTREKLLSIIDQARIDDELKKLDKQEAAELEEIKKIADDYLQKSSDDGYIIHLLSNKVLRKDSKRLEKTLSNLNDNDIFVAVDNLSDNLSKKLRKILEDHAHLEVHGLTVEDKAKKIVSYLKDLDIRLYGEKKTM